MSRLRISALLNHSSGTKANARIIPLTFFTFITLFLFLTTLLRSKFVHPEKEPGVSCGTGPGHPGVFVVRSLLSPQEIPVAVGDQPQTQLHSLCSPGEKSCQECPAQAFQTHNNIPTIKSKCRERIWLLPVSA